MSFAKFLGGLFVIAYSLGTANAEVVEKVKATAEDAKKFEPVPQVVELKNGDKVMATDSKTVWQTFALRNKVEVSPDKIYKVTAKVKLKDKEDVYVWLGFIPYSKDGKAIRTEHGNRNIKESFTALAEDAKKGAKTIVVKDASQWKKGKYYFVAFDASEDMSDIPNFNISPMIEKIEQTGDKYTITLTAPLEKNYAAGTNIRQHRGGATYVYRKSGRAPKDWMTWKGTPATSKDFRKAKYIRPMIMFRSTNGSTAAFKDFVFEIE